MKTKALISCAVTAQLICVFVFAYADCLFSGAAAQISFHRMVVKPAVSVSILGFSNLLDETLN